MSRHPLAGFRADPSYACATWQECRAADLMWQTTPVETAERHGPYMCGCGKPMTTLVTRVDVLAADLPGASR